MELPCKECISLAICVSKRRVSCDTLNEYLWIPAFTHITPAELRKKRLPGVMEVLRKECHRPTIRGASEFT